MGGINSNVDLLQFEESNGTDRDRRSSLNLNCSMTDNVNGGFDVGIVEEKVSFDAQAETSPKKVHYVEENSGDDESNDLFANMNVKEKKETIDDDKLMNAFKDVLHLANKKQNEHKQNHRDKEEEREKDEEELVVDNANEKSVDVGATWAKIKKEVEVLKPSPNSKKDSSKKRKDKKHQKKNNKKKQKKQKNKSKNEKKQKKEKEKEKVIAIEVEKKENVSDAKIEIDVQESEKASVCSSKSSIKAVSKPKRKRNKD